MAATEIERKCRCLYAWINGGYESQNDLIELLYLWWVTRIGKFMLKRSLLTNQAFSGVKTKFSMKNCTTVKKKSVGRMMLCE